MRLTLIALLIMMTTGCTSYVLKPAADWYCKMPADERQAWRGVADIRTKPHEVRIYCHVDP